MDEGLLDFVQNMLTGQWLKSLTRDPTQTTSPDQPIQEETIDRRISQPWSQRPPVSFQPSISGRPPSSSPTLLASQPSEPINLVDQISGLVGSPLFSALISAIASKTMTPKWAGTGYGMGAAMMGGSQAMQQAQRHQEKLQLEQQKLRQPNLQHHTLDTGKEIIEYTFNPRTGQKVEIGRTAKEVRPTETRLQHYTIDTGTEIIEYTIDPKSGERKEIGRSKKEAVPEKPGEVALRKAHTKEAEARTERIKQQMDLADDPTATVGQLGSALLALERTTPGDEGDAVLIAMAKKKVLLALSRKSPKKSSGMQGGSPVPIQPKGEELPQELPPGSKHIGTKNGKPVYESPDGKRWVVE